MRTKFYISLILVVSVLLVFGGIGNAQEEYVMKFGWADPPDPLNQSTSAYAQVLKASVEQFSGGRIKVELYPAGQLGDQRSGTEQVRKGTIEAYNITLGVMASLYYPEFLVFDMPFAFSSREIASRVLDSQRNPFTKKMVEDCAQKTGIRALLAPYGFQMVCNDTRPIRTPDDAKGLKIRSVETVSFMKALEAWGASPVPMPMLELYSALQNKVIDGVQTAIQTLTTQKLYQIQKYATLTNHILTVGATLINEEWYQSLPDDLKLALVEGERLARQTYIGFGELLDTLVLSQLEELGMEIYSPTPEELQMFKEKTVPYVREWMEQEVGPELVAEFLAAIEAAEEELKIEAGVVRK